LYFKEKAIELIKSFKSKEAEKIWNLTFSKKLPQSIQQVALRKLEILNSVVKIEELKVPPNNRLERLKGDRSHQYSIRINQQYRICFEWIKGDVYNVEIVDYH
jgi:toxin HigB-1